jgi:hypothetical protein
LVVCGYIDGRGVGGDVFLGGEEFVERFVVLGEVVARAKGGDGVGGEVNDGVDSDCYIIAKIRWILPRMGVYFLRLG